jgi:hypothetical protein
MGTTISSMTTQEIFWALISRKREKGLQNYQITEFLRISPTADTQKKLRGHQVLLKVQPDGFVLAAKADPADTSKMFNPLGSGDILRFVLTTDRDDFKHFTNLRTNANELVYLCNQTPSEIRDYPFISQWPRYMMADLLTVILTPLPILREPCWSTALPSPRLTKDCQPGDGC